MKKVRFERRDYAEIVKLAWSEWSQGLNVHVMEVLGSYDPEDETCEYYCNVDFGNTYYETDNIQLYTLDGNFIANGCFHENDFLDEEEVEKVTEWLESEKNIEGWSFAPEDRKFWKLEIMKELKIDDEYDERMENMLEFYLHNRVQKGYWDDVEGNM